MIKKKGFDHDRQEAEPPRVPEPWEIVKHGNLFCLLKGKVLMKNCIAQSENGAHREGMVFIKEMDF